MFWRSRSCPQRVGSADKRWLDRERSRLQYSPWHSECPVVKRSRSHGVEPGCLDTIRTRSAASGRDRHTWNGGHHRGGHGTRHGNPASSRWDLRAGRVRGRACRFCTAHAKRDRTASRDADNPQPGSARRFALRSRTHRSAPIYTQGNLPGSAGTGTIPKRHLPRFRCPRSRGAVRTVWRP